MQDRRNGSSLLEFVFIFPMGLLLFTGLFFVVLMGLRQAVLSYQAARLARTAVVSGRAPAGAIVETREIPLIRMPLLHRTPRRLEIVTLELSQPVSFFRWSKTLTARAKEVRVTTKETP